jgi:hypothetical protein
MLVDYIYPIGHLLLSVAEIYLFFGLLQLWQRSRSLDMFLLALIVVALSYDNAVLGMGTKIGSGEFLEQLNRYRYFIHYITVPLLLVIGVEQANRAGAGWAIPLVRSLSALLAVILGIAGITADYPGLTLEPIEFAGILRYAPEHVNAPPLVTIAVSIFITAIGIGIWIRSEGQWSGLLISAITALIGNALPLSIVGTLPGSVSEFLLCLSLLLTERYLQRYFPALQLGESEEFRFIPLSFDWVAIHPRPKGVVYFVGGAGFGSFPTVFYRYILRRVYQAGYTVVALPFRFTFNHWSVAIHMVQHAKDLREAIYQEACYLGYTENLDLYRDPAQFKQGNYFWLAHSLGCKYVAFLELLGKSEQIKTLQRQGIGSNGSNKFADCLKNPQQGRKLESLLQGLDPNYISLENQPSILMAPIITGIEGAIPIPALAKVVKPFLDARPSQEETECLIKKDGLFHYTALIGFARDGIQKKAGTLNFLRRTLPQAPYPLLDKTLPGSHLAPLNLFHRNENLAKELVRYLFQLNERVKSQNLMLEAESGDQHNELVYHLSQLNDHVKSQNLMLEAESGDQH